MSHVWETVKSHTRRWSSGATKIPLQRVEDENSTTKLSLKLGDTTLVYQDHEWVRESETFDKERKHLYARNKHLEAENQLLEYKVNVLLDMLAVTKLDVVALQKQQESQK